MPSLITDAEIFSAEVKKIFGVLETKGFQFQNASIKHTDAIGDYAEILVSNRSTGKRLAFMYAPARNIRPEAISIFLQNDSGDMFSISDFLVHKKINPLLRRSISLVNYHGALEEKFAGALRASKEIIFQYLESHLFGSEWDSIPIQWGGLK
jgi:hypothetical protein